MATTVIHNVAWAVAWHARYQRHLYLRDTDIAFIYGRINHVGGPYQGEADIKIDGPQVVADGKVMTMDMENALGVL